MTTKTETQAQAYFAIIRSEIFLWDTMDLAFKDAGISLGMARYIPLHILAQQPLHLQDLASCCHNKESAMSRLVERMEKDGLVEKRADATDRRAKVLTLTPKGKKLEKKARAVFEAALKNTFGGLSTAQTQDLLTLLAPFANSGKK